MGLTHFPNGISSFGMPIVGAGARELTTTGTVYFVDSNTGNDGNTGNNPTDALATIDAAINKTTANEKDIIFVMPGHAESVSSAITADVAGISIIGLGNGQNRPSITPGVTNSITISADDVKIANLRFVTPSTSIDRVIYLNAADAVIKDCLFECGANFLNGITISASGDNGLIKDNEFRITADGPDTAINFSGAAEGTQIVGNYFMGDNDTNAWDVAAIDGADSGGNDVVITNTRIEGNRFLYGMAIDINSAGTTGIIADNYMGEGTLGSMLDPGALMCFENYEADAVDETGRAFPTGAAA